MSSLLVPIADTAPPDYHVPEFPSLYITNLFTTSRGIYLYHTSNIWRFTLFWTLIFFGATHAAVGAYAVFVYLMSRVRVGVGRRTRAKGMDGGAGDGKKAARQSNKNNKSTSLGLLAVLVSSLFIFLWGIGQAVVAGSIVGGLLGAVYEGGGFRMSTWIPVVWAGISTLVVVLGSFSIQGGM